MNENATNSEGEIIVEKEMAVDASHALIALNRSELDVGISTAKAYPRSLKQFREEALEQATLDEETAASMFYVLPARKGGGGKKIDGPSVRLAEIVGSCWGNLRYGARIVAIDDEFVTAQGACHDLQRNNSIQYEVKRRITTNKGQRFSDDMIQVTCNAACSIALRQAIFKIVPRSFINSLYEAAKLASIGKAKTMAQKRASAMEWFIKAGASEKDVLAAIGKAGIDDVTTDDIITLRGLATAIKDGDTTLEEALGKNGHAPGSKVGESDLADVATANGGKKKPAKKKQPPAEREPGDEPESLPGPAEPGFDPDKWEENDEGVLFPKGQATPD